jgi:hypothetical protein
MVGGASWSGVGVPDDTVLGMWVWCRDCRCDRRQLSSTASAAVFSSILDTRRVPGIGAMSSPRVRIHASAVCARVARLAP